MKKKLIELKMKQNFTDKHTKKDYKKGFVYQFTEERANELLENQYLVEKVGESEIEEKEEKSNK